VGDAGDDIILGGVKGDILLGAGEVSTVLPPNALDDDIIIGDEGHFAFNLAGTFADPSEGVGDGDPATLDLIETINMNLGGVDYIHGDDGNDIALGGAGGDILYGDFYGLKDTGLSSAPNPGIDILFGDAGRIRLQNDQISLIRSIDTGIGGVDRIEGNEGDDILIGGAGGDRLFGEAESIILGQDGSVLFGTVNNLALIKAGGAGNDIILGDNGELSWLLTSDTIVGRPDVSTITFAGGASTLDRITTFAPTDGDADSIVGNGNRLVLNPDGSAGLGSSSAAPVRTRSSAIPTTIPTTMPTDRMAMM
jgi:Ca2+-binding RTX toxin-like protein